jgi:hypothetical protein
LPNGRTLPVRGNVWKLITILPKHWQPPAAAAPVVAEEIAIQPAICSDGNLKRAD